MSIFTCSEIYWAQKSLNFVGILYMTNIIYFLRQEMTQWPRDGPRMSRTLRLGSSFGVFCLFVSANLFANRCNSCHIYFIPISYLTFYNIFTYFNFNSMWFHFVQHTKRRCCWAENESSCDKCDKWGKMCSSLRSVRSPLLQKKISTCLFLSAVYVACKFFLSSWSRVWSCEHSTYIKITDWSLRL